MCSKARIAADRISRTKAPRQLSFEDSDFWTQNVYTVTEDWLRSFPYEIQFRRNLISRAMSGHS